MRFEPDGTPALARDLALVDEAALLAAWPAWLASCEALAAPGRPHRQQWLAPCAAAHALQPQRGAQVREFLAGQLDAYRVLGLDGRSGAPREAALLTGYFEPEAQGSRVRSAGFAAPLYRLPRVVPSAPRSVIESSGLLRGDELVWLRDAMEAFFIEVQGSGRVCLQEGGCVRLSYAGNNGRAYRSIGAWLVEQGELRREEVSMQSIASWAHAHPQRIRELLDQNPRVVFFREGPDRSGKQGPAGSLGVPLTPEVSAAVDPRCLPLGAPLLLLPAGDTAPQGRGLLALAQDTGGAIKGPLRVDQFRGSGAEAAQAAGPQRGAVTIRLLVPRGVAPAALLGAR